MKLSTEELYKVYLGHPLITTDSRKAVPGCLYFALKGNTFDGNDFVNQAIQQGAAYAITDNPANESPVSIVVEDVLKTLQELASIHRNNLNIPVIGITGTNGKTTTKELTAAVLSSHFQTHATSGNLNNHIGVPLTILSAPASTDLLIVEMGANHVGEISVLCTIARPTHGIITNIGRAHLEGFGGFEGVVKAKSELYHFLYENHGHAFVNAENQLLMGLSSDLDRTLYGTSSFCEIRGSVLASDPFLKVSARIGTSDHEIETSLVGQYNFENVMSAICIGNYFDVPAVKIARAISEYMPGNNRSQAIDTGRNLVVADFYNANPSSMKAALENFSTMKAGKKMVILGDMFELGNESGTEHRSITELVKALNFDRVIFAGPEFMKVAGENFDCFTSSAEVYEWLKKEQPSGYSVLLKGSRGSRMENILPAL